MYLHDPARFPGRVPLARARGRTPTPSEGERPLFGLRLGLIERVRREIASGVYDTPEKWELALQRLFAEVEGR